MYHVTFFGKYWS